MTKKKPGTILIIEDEADIRKFAARVLEIEGYHVLQAGDAEQAMAIIQEESISLVLLDLILPKGDGWQILQKLKADPLLSHIPVVIFSASAGEAERHRAMKLGAADYLVKPVSASDLSHIVGRVLDA